MKFKLMEQLREAKKKSEAAHAELARREQAALEEVQALKAEYEAKLTSSLRSGKDETAKLDEINEKIDSATKRYEARHAERQMYTSIVNEGITPPDIVGSWNNEYLPQYRKERIEPVFDKLLAAKKDFVEAFFEYMAEVDEYNSVKEDTISEAGSSVRYKLKEIEATTAEIDRYFFTDMQIRDLAKGKLPLEIKEAIPNLNIKGAVM